MHEDAKLITFMPNTRQNQTEVITRRSMTRDQWYKHLLNGTGPLDAENVETLKPTPALLKLLRELLVLPWPEHDEPELEAENDAPFFAMLLLGLLRDEESIPQLITLLGHAVENDWDALADVAPPTIAAIGTVGLPLVLAELERLEREARIHADEISKKRLDESPLYRYWALVIAAEQIALNHPETREEVARFAEPRIRDAGHDRPAPKTAHARKQAEAVGLPTVAELWVDLQISLRRPELEEAVSEFFDRHGPDYSSHIFGGREDYDEIMASEAPEGDARERVLDTYAALRNGEFDEDEDDEEEDDDDDDDEDDDEVDDDDDDDDDEDEDEDDEESHEPYVREEPKVGRNEPCPCGSGRKYKRCHGAPA